MNSEIAGKPSSLTVAPASKTISEVLRQLDSKSGRLLLSRPARQRARASATASRGVREVRLNGAAISVCVAVIKGMVLGG